MIYSSLFIGLFVFIGYSKRSLFESEGECQLQELSAGDNLETWKLLKWQDFADIAEAAGGRLPTRQEIIDAGIIGESQNWCGSDDQWVPTYMINDPENPRPEIISILPKEPQCVKDWVQFKQPSRLHWSHLDNYYYPTWGYDTTNAHCWKGTSIVIAVNCEPICTGPGGPPERTPRHQASEGTAPRPPKEPKGGERHASPPQHEGKPQRRKLQSGEEPEENVGAGKHKHKGKGKGKGKGKRNSKGKGHEEPERPEENAGKGKHKGKGKGVKDPEEPEKPEESEGNAGKRKRKHKGKRRKLQTDGDVGDISAGKGPKGKGKGPEAPERPEQNPEEGGEPTEPEGTENRGKGKGKGKAGFFGQATGKGRIN